MAESTKRSRSLDETRLALERWRRMHGGRGRPIPAALWSEAAAVARAEGVNATARALRLSPPRLAKLVASTECESRTTERRDGEAPAFVALDGLRLGAGREPSAVLELVSREGERVRVEVLGDASGVDLVGLARAFWGRGT